VFRLSVKLLASAAAPLCVLVLLPASATAAPRAVDFELAPRDGAVVAASGAGVRSQPVRTPQRFNLVGMRWRGRAEPEIELRVRRGGRWSRWEHLEVQAAHNPDPRRGEPTAAASNPLWVGAANAVQYRMNRRVPRLRLHFVRVARRPVVAARAAQAQQPAVVSRAQWGASACPPRRAPQYGEVRAVNVHHTVSLNDYSPAEAAAMVLAICRYHRNSNGWDDIGYNALVDKYGVLYEGRAGGLDRAVVGAQAQGFNATTAGIASIGDNTVLGASPEELQAIAGYIRWKLPIHLQPVSGSVTVTSSGGSLTRYPAGARVTLERVSGHRDTGRTACPGNALYAQLPQLRSMVESGAFQPVSAFSTRLSALLGDSAVDYGQTVPVSGSLVGSDGAPIGSQRVDLQVSPDGRWHTARKLTTAPDGTYATELRPRLRMYVRTRFRGHGGFTGSGSTRLLLRLRPLITIDRPPRRARVLSTVPITGRVAPRKRLLRLVLQQQVRSGWRKVGVRAVFARRGRFSTSFVPRSSGRFRFYVAAKSDPDTDRGSSVPAELRVGR
jgi:N-acetylmuramoyl-L-alanine amidase